MSDTVALTSVIASGVLGAGGLTVAVTSGFLDRKQTRTLAREQRHQARLEVAYVELLTFVEEIGMWCQTILPMIGGDPANPEAVVQMPEPQREVAVMARTVAFASPTVRDALEEWRVAIRGVYAQVTLVRMRRTTADQWHGTAAMAEDGADWSGAWSDLETVARPAELDARKALQAAIAAELNPPAA